ncbi:MAG: T9SS type A sorting domain-containing protein, partial [Bacteroides sp.]|nr:T9SS type A sorting domain-containing protein [Bacteroides sp.]
TATVRDDQTVSYVPNPGFTQKVDTVYYKASMQSNLNIADSSMMVIFVNLPVGLEGSLSMPGVSLYPNPSSGELTILADPMNKISSLTLYDLSGRKIFEEKGISAPEGRYMIHMDAYRDGYYYVAVEGENGARSVLPFILQR